MPISAGSQPNTQSAPTMVQRSLPALPTMLSSGAATRCAARWRAARCSPSDSTWMLNSSLYCKLYVSLCSLQASNPAAVVYDVNVVLHELGHNFGSVSGCHRLQPAACMGS